MMGAIAQQYLEGHKLAMECKLFEEAQTTVFNVLFGYVLDTRSSTSSNFYRKMKVTKRLKLENIILMADMQDGAQTSHTPDQQIY